MGATRDAVGLIGGVLRSLIALIDGSDEAKGSSEHTPHDWQTTEQKRAAKERLANYHRRLAHADRIKPAPTPPAPGTEEKPEDSA